MENNYQDVRKKNLEYFTRTLEEAADEHHAVAQSKQSHLKRFVKMLDLGDFRGKTLLDVGCGIGGFYDFLKERDIHCQYTGIDINEKMIEKARQLHPHMKEDFFVCDIIEEKLDREFDYVLSVGPLNLKFAGDLNIVMTMRLVKEMHNLARVGAAISMTSSWTQKPNFETFYYEPCHILAETAKFCVNSKFDHTYLPHDFTLFLYKAGLYT